MDLQKRTLFRKHWRRWVFIGATVGMTLFSHSYAQPIRFTEIARETGVNGYVVGGQSTYGHGVASVDLNHDTLPDLYITHAVRDKTPPDLLFLSTGLLKYKEMSQKYGTKDAFGNTGSHGAVFVDIDNDGDFDLFNGSTDERNHLYLNRGEQGFEDISQQAGLESSSFGTRGVVALDADSDGLMDLFAINWYNLRTLDAAEPNEFYHNTGDGRFERWNNGTLYLNETGMGVQGVSAVDVDNDSDVDLFIARRNYGYLPDQESYGLDPDRDVQNLLLINDGSGHFTEQTRSRGLAIPNNNSNGAAWGDIDNDGDLDCFVVQKDRKALLRIFENKGGVFQDRSGEHNIHTGGYNVLLLDLENDGDLDLFTMKLYGRMHVYLNDGTGHFTATSASGLGDGLYDPRGATVADFDRDGDPDIYFVDANKYARSAYHNHFLRNETPSTNNWIRIQGRGPSGDQGGFGSQIWVFPAGRMNEMDSLVGYRQVINAYGYLCQDDPVQLIGIGERDSVDVRVTLLDGTTLETSSVPAGTTLHFSRPTTLTVLEGNDRIVSPGTRIPIQLEIRNAFGMPVPGAEVTADLEQGEGILADDPDGHVILRSDFTGRVSLNFTAKGGHGEYRIRFRSAEQEVVIRGTLLTASPNRMTLVSEKTLAGVVGEEVPDSLVVQILDEWGDGCPETMVTFAVESGGGILNGEHQTVTVLTRGAGRASVSWQLGTQSDVEHRVVISSRSEGRDLEGSPIIVTAKARPDSAFDLQWVGQASPTGYSGQPLSDSLHLLVSDQFGNPVPDTHVELWVDQEDGVLEGDSHRIRRTTSVSGALSVYWRLGTLAGVEQTIRAQLVDGHTSRSIDHSVAVMHPDAYELIWSGPETLSGMARTPLRDSLRARVVSVSGEPIPRYAVTFRVTSGTGTLEGQANLMRITDGRGMATCLWTLGPEVGPDVQQVRMHAQYLNVSSLSMAAQSFPYSPYSIEKLSGDQQKGRYGHVLDQDIVVRVTDSKGPVMGQNVKLSIVSGGGQLSPTPPLKSDKNGLVSVSWILGTEPEQVLSAFVEEYPTRQVTFTATATENQPPEILAPSDTSVTVDTILEFPIMTRDSDGDSIHVRVSNLPKGADFNPLTGWFMWRPDRQQTGTHVLRFIAFDRYGGRTEHELLITVVRNNNVPILYMPVDTTIHEMQMLEWHFRVSDPDGDTVSIRIADPPEGSVFHPDDMMLTWQPTFQQAGEYGFDVTVDDGHGGIQTHTLVIHVKEYNQKPVLDFFQPRDSLVQVISGESICFKVHARDDDGDTLSYQWMVNEAPVSRDSTWVLVANKTLGEKARISVRVSDQHDTVTHHWKLVMITDVDMDPGILPETALLPAYPNPFNASTTLRFSLDSTARVVIKIFNARGRFVQTLCEETRPAGEYHLSWDGRNHLGIPVPSGLYICRFSGDGYHSMRKLILLK